MRLQRPDEGDARGDGVAADEAELDAHAVRRLQQPQPHPFAVHEYRAIGRHVTGEYLTANEHVELAPADVDAAKGALRLATVGFGGRWRHGRVRNGGK